MSKKKKVEVRPDVSESQVIPMDLLSEEIEAKPKAEDALRAELIQEIKDSADKLGKDEAAIGDLKILSRTLKELRYAFKVFTPYRKKRKVTVFGSARLKPETQAYQLAVDFGKQMADEGWFVLTGAGGGIMEAGHVGAGKEMSMGVNIMLPFEQSSNYIIEGDPKLVHLKYFFTRKLLFVKEVHAVAIFAGGFGTQDECFETLTLVQTGKRDLMPMVFVERPGETYWSDWLDYVNHNLLRRGLISPEDTSLFKVTDNAEEAVNEIMHFYTVYNSMRYVKGKLVLRLHHEPTDECVERLNDEFSSICESGKIEKVQTHKLEEEDKHLIDLPRLGLHFNRRDMGKLRQMIDFLNDELCNGGS